MEGQHRADPRADGGVKPTERDGTVIWLWVLLAFGVLALILMWVSASVL